MDIKESFHNKLNQIREGAEHSYGEHGKLVASAINHFGTKDHPAADESNLHLFSNKYVKSVLKKAHKHVTPEYQETLTNLMGSLKEDYDPNEARMANRAKEFFDDPSMIVKSNARKIYKKHNKKATTGMDEAKSAPDRVVTASKKAEKGTKWRLQSRDMDSDGSSMELRQGKRVKLRGAFDRHAQDFSMSPTKKCKIDWKAKSKYYDDPKDILKTVKESEQIDEISSKLASSYLRGNHKSVTDKKGIKIWKAFKRADGRELAVDKLSGTAKVPTKG